jgi:hypothetical protein
MHTVEMRGKISPMSVMVLGANQSGRHRSAMKVQKGLYTQFSTGVYSFVWYLNLSIFSSYSLDRTTVIV